MGAVVPRSLTENFNKGLGNLTVVRGAWDEDDDFTRATVIPAEPEAIAGCKSGDDNHTDIAGASDPDWPTTCAAPPVTGASSSAPGASRIPAVIRTHPRAEPTHPPRLHRRRMACSMSSIDLGMEAVRFTGPRRVTRMSSSMRMPNPRSGR